MKYFTREQSVSIIGMMAVLATLDIVDIQCIMEIMDHIEEHTVDSTVEGVELTTAMWCKIRL